MKRVLWISRRQMTLEQRADLERAAGDTVVLIRWKAAAKDLPTLASLVEWSDVVAAELPLELLAEVVRLAGRRPVLQAVWDRVPAELSLSLSDGREVPPFTAVHRCWRQIHRLELEMRDLTGKKIRYQP